MIQRRHSDFFERLSRDIAAVFATLLGYTIENAELELEEAYMEWFGLDRAAFEGLTAEEMISLLNDNPEIGIDHMESIADLLAEEGKWYFEKKEYLKSKRKLEKALKLFDFVDQQKQLYSFERQVILKEIESLIKTINESHSTDNDLR